VQAGRLGPNGDWVDGEVSPIARVAQTFAQEPANATEWYFPSKLSIDLDAANALRPNALTRDLTLRPLHRREVDLPLCAVQTDLTGDPLTAAPDHNRFLKTVVPFLRSLR
jgi:hypothetical protein